MSELDRLDARGPRPSTWSAYDHFREERLWARWVDDLDAEAERYWREARCVWFAWAMAVLGWIAATAVAVLWWRSIHG